jgi:hypothetical protein
VNLPKIQTAGFKKMTNVFLQIIEFNSYTGPSTENLNTHLFTEITLSLKQELKK